MLPNSSTFSHWARERILARSNASSSWLPRDSQTSVWAIWGPCSC